jgi:microcystin-dependent protein
MPEPYLSEIRLMPFNFAPKGWALCNGQTLAINTNTALFALLGTAYGGNGTTTFALPNLQGMVPMHFGNGFKLAAAVGEASHTLAISEMPHHDHILNATNAAASAAIPGPTFALAPAATVATPAVAVNIYAPPAASLLVTFDQTAIATAGSSQGHENRQPFLVLSFCIATIGIYPSRQ